MNQKRKSLRKRKEEWVHTVKVQKSNPYEKSPHYLCKKNGCIKNLHFALSFEDVLFWKQFFLLSKGNNKILFLKSQYSKKKFLLFSRNVWSMISTSSRLWNKITCNLRPIWYLHENSFDPPLIIKSTPQKASSWSRVTLINSSGDWVFAIYGLKGEISYASHVPFFLVPKTHLQLAVLLKTHAIFSSNIILHESIWPLCLSKTIIIYLPHDTSLIR